jgi:hypothetical protein
MGDREVSRVNERQVGGDHYQKSDYQHWDWVCDVGLHYLLGCATKYVARWRMKNGVEDLQKAVHYLDKAMERGIPPRRAGVGTQRFILGLPEYEAQTVFMIARGDYEAAKVRIQKLIDNELSSGG